MFERRRLDHIAITAKDEDAFARAMRLRGWRRAAVFVSTPPLADLPPKLYVNAEGGPGPPQTRS